MLRLQKQTPEADSSTALDVAAVLDPPLDSSYYLRVYMLRLGISFIR